MKKTITVTHQDKTMIGEIIVTISGYKNRVVGYAGGTKVDESAFTNEHNMLEFIDRLTKIIIDRLTFMINNKENKPKTITEELHSRGFSENG